LFPRSRLLLRWREASFNVVVLGEDEFPGRHLGGVEQRRRCVWRVDLGEWQEKWLGHGWMRGKRRKTSFVSPTFVAHQVFALSRRPRSPPCGLGMTWERQMENATARRVGWAGFLAPAHPNNFGGRCVCVWGWGVEWRCSQYLYLISIYVSLGLNPD
jgi:hypothetical protein